MDEHKVLVEECIKRDPKAQRRLYDLFASRLYAVCQRYTKSTLEAEDVLQESFIRIFNSIEKFRGESRLEYWMKRIVINTALNMQRSKLYMFPMAAVEDMKEIHSTQDTLASFRFEELLTMIRSLPAGCQVIFNLFAIEGYSHREIAELMNIKEGTSKSQYARARKLLQEMILKENRHLYETPIRNSSHTKE
ncbi:MAG: RNA polymerase sigma factor [Cyclobacteriaceae bacterium]|nr:RNA polymerase sigma factor [Cyclobacteriaceae bacterium]